MVNITTPPIIHRVQTETSVAAMIRLRGHFFPISWAISKVSLMCRLSRSWSRSSSAHHLFIAADMDFLYSSSPLARQMSTVNLHLKMHWTCCCRAVSYLFIFYLCHLCAGRLWFQGYLVFKKVTEILTLLPCSMHAFTCELVPPTDRAGYNSFTLKLGTLIGILPTEWNQSSCVSQSS